MEVRNAGAHKKCNSSPDEATERGREGKRAGAAFRAVLFRQPKGVHSEIGSAYTQKEQAHYEPEQSSFPQIEDVAKTYGDKDQH